MRDVFGPYPIRRTEKHFVYSGGDRADILCSYRQRKKIGKCRNVNRDISENALRRFESLSQLEP